MNPSKKTVLLAVLILLGLFFVGCGAEKKESKNASAPAGKPSGTQVEEKIILKFASPLPAHHVVSTDGDKYFIKRVEELTNGKVQFKYYPAEQLGKAKDMLDLIKGGAADIGLVITVYISGKVPLSGVVELPGLYDEISAGNRAALKLVNALYDFEYKKLGIKPLTLTILTPINEVHTIKKPVKSLHDLRGLKIRVPGGVLEEICSRAGGTPVSLPSMEAYEALQRGIMDGIFFSHYSCEPYKLNEILKYGTVGTALGSTSGIYGINETTWQKLPEDVKKAMQQAANETNVHLAEALQSAEEVAIKKAKEQGKVIYYLNPEEQKEWKVFLAPTQDKWVEALEQKGLPARQVLDIYKNALKEIKT